MKTLRTAGMVIAVAVVSASCGTGDVADTSLPRPEPLAPEQTPAAATCIPPACQDPPLTPTPHVVRLKNSQWERTMRDLLKLGVLPGSSVGFPADPVSSPDRFGGEAGDLVVSSDYWTAYQKAAEALAALVAEDPVKLDKLLPAAAKTGAVPVRVNALVTDLLPRAYRRPVTTAEIAAVIAAGEGAASEVTTGDPFTNRVKWILTAILQSPKLIYRVALGETEVKDGRARLTDYEIANKLAYGLWGTMPDDALFADVKAGKLATKAGVAEVARTMLKDPRASTALMEFHDQLYLLEYFPEVTNRPLSLFPRFYTDFMKDAQQDMRRTVEELVVKNEGGMKELSTSTVAFVNKKLAAVYGIDPNTVPELVTGNPDTFAKVQLDPTQRKGLLMHAGWLAYEGTPKDPSPIRRGAFVTRHVVCSPLGSPPPGAAGADPSTKPEPTNRKRVEVTTKGCGDGCHGGPTGVINPLGFAFEGFDSIGQIRTKDGEEPVDTTGELALLGKFAGAVALFDAVSTNARAHACYAAHWSSYLNGTSFIDVTPIWLSPAVAKSLQNGSVRDIIVELVQTDAFLTVSR